VVETHFGLTVWGAGLQLDEVKEEIPMTLVQVQCKVRGRAIGFVSGKNLEAGRVDYRDMCTNVRMQIDKHM